MWLRNSIARTRLLGVRLRGGKRDRERRATPDGAKAEGVLHTWLTRHSHTFVHSAHLCRAHCLATVSRERETFTLSNSCPAHSPHDGKCANHHLLSVNVKRSREQVAKSFARAPTRARRPARSGRMGAGEADRHGNRGRHTWHGSHKRCLATRSPVEQRVSSPMLTTTVGADRGRGLLATGIVYV